MGENIREAKAKYDLIGCLHNSELFELLGMQRFESLGEKEAWNHFMNNLSKEAGKEADKLVELALLFGNEREETGFRIGFHIAMRVCMEGLNRL